MPCTKDRCPFRWTTRDGAIFQTLRQALPGYSEAMKTARALKITVVPPLVLLVLACVGCGGAKDDWYDQSVHLEQRKDAFIDHQIQSGVPPEQARKLWQTRYATELTEGHVDPTAGEALEFQKR